MISLGELRQHLYIQRTKEHITAQRRCRFSAALVMTAVNTATRRLSVDAEGFHLHMHSMRVFSFFSPSLLLHQAVKRACCNAVPIWKVPPDAPSHYPSLLFV